MSILPEIRVGDPLRYESLTVFPLFVPPNGKCEYLLADEAISAGSVNVVEVSEGGSVPDLLVTNKSDSKILFLEGEELRGAKQNRVLNTSVLVAAQSATKIPVSCVEQGRWRYRSREFCPSDSHSSSKLRLELKQSVARSLKAGAGHTSDQMAVWREVGRQMTSLGASSETAAMADTYASHHSSLSAFRERVPYIEGASGFAAAIGDKVVALDLFDKPSTCRKVWDRLMTGVVMDALEARPSDELAQSHDLQDLLGRLRSAAWLETKPVGEGREYRTDAVPGTHASALVLGESVLHASLVAAT